MKKKWKFFRGYPEKRIFTINVGTIDPNVVEGYIARAVERFRGQPLQLDHHTNLIYNEILRNEDIFIPV
jgi:hypothetical protein